MKNRNRQPWQENSLHELLKSEAAFREQKKRPCHDCGKLIYNYRCEECWDKLKDKYADDIDL